MLFFKQFQIDIMFYALNLCTLLEKYSYSKQISEEELDFMERSWLESLNSNHYNRYPGIAPAVVCDKAGVSRGSFWIICNAAILDKIRPLDSSRTRQARILDVLSQSGLIAA